MVRSISWWLIVLSPVVLHPSTAWSQTPEQPAPTSNERQAQKATDGNNYRIYDLRILGDDAEFCDWVANTIPDVIQPESWKAAGGTGSLRYYPPTKILVIYQTPDAHAQVDAFVKNMKKTLPQEKGKVTAASGRLAPDVIQTQFTVPKAIQTGDASPLAPYLIPTPTKQPKHLFHFIIRYEGAGEGNSQEKGKGEATDDSLFGQAQDAISKVIQTGDASPLRSCIKPALAKSNQMFHCIIRYEGEGIIDSNMVELIKSYLAADDEKPATPMPVNPPPSADRPITPEHSPKPPSTAPPLPTPGAPGPDASEPVKTPLGSVPSIFLPTLPPKAF